MTAPRLTTIAVEPYTLDRLKAIRGKRSIHRRGMNEVITELLDMNEKKGNASVLSGSEDASHSGREENHYKK
jgi:hypothetical protein